MARYNATSDHNAPMLNAEVAIVPRQELHEPPEEQLLQEEVELLAVDADTGRLRNIKVLTDSEQTGNLPPLAYDLEAGIRASLDRKLAATEAAVAAESALQAHVARLEGGARLDLTTPKDGHCLLHALRAGGIASFRDIPCQLTIEELRRMALSIASEDEIAVAAAGTGANGVSVETYKKTMVANMWGDNLMIACLARLSNKDITVISGTCARTFFARGGEAQGALMSAVWIAHRGEFHYYGVHRSGQGDELGRTGGFDGTCPICTTAFECAVCAYRRDIAEFGHPISERPAKRYRLKSKCNRPAGFFPPSVPQPPKQKHDPLPLRTCTKKAAPTSSSIDARRTCGNCGIRGHVATTCVQPCFACQGNHKYYECDHPDLYHEAQRMANRNRVKWQGFGSTARSHKGTSGMKESGTGRYWVRQHYDPDYVPEREIVPRRGSSWTSTATRRTGAKPPCVPSGTSRKIWL